MAVKKIVDPKLKPEDQEIDPNLVIEEEPNEGDDELEVDAELDALTDPKLLKQKILEERKKANDLKSSKERVEKESREWKKKFQQSSKSQEDKELQRLEQEGNTKELLEKEREKNKKLTEKFIGTSTQTLRKTLEAEVLKYAPDVHDVADVINNLNKNSYSMDSETLEVSDVDVALSEVRKVKPYLFKNAKMPNSYNGGTTPNVPNNVKIYSTEEYNKLSLKDKKRALGNKQVAGLQKNK